MKISCQRSGPGALRYPVAFLLRENDNAQCNSASDAIIYSGRALRCRVNKLPRSWIAIVALIAAFGVLFVLVSPAPDELPSTGPHSLHKMFVLAANYFGLLPPEVFTGLQLQLAIHVLLTSDDVIALTCARLC